MNADPCLSCPLADCDESSKLCALLKPRREYQREYMREYHRNRYANDPEFAERQREYRRNRYAKQKLEKS